MTSNRLVVGICAALATVMFAAAPAVAQKTPPKTPAKKAPATKAPAKKAAPAATKKKTAKKSTSPCQGLSKTQCGSNKVCGWIEPKKKTDKRGRKLTPYCRKVAGIAKKKKK